MKALLFAAICLLSSAVNAKVPSFCTGADIRSFKTKLYPDPSTLANIVYTDQRGSGCNTLERRSDMYKTKYFAEDVVGIIRDLRAQGIRRYVIYGHSFGSYHATLTAARIQDYKRAGEDIELPESVVLEGVIGKAFARGANLNTYAAQWSKVRSLLSPAAQAAIEQPDPLRLPLDSWGYFIMLGLYEGRMPGQTHIPDLEAKLEALTLPTSDPKFQELHKEVATSVFEGFGDSFRTISCHEIDTDFFARPILVNGEFRTDGNLCGGLHLTDAYDSKNYQLEVPIIYFSGTNDAATPSAQGRYHFNNQKQPIKSFVSIGEAGHNSLQLSLYGCKGQLWDLILKNKRLTQDDLKACPWAWPISVD